MIPPLVYQSFTNRESCFTIGLPPENVILEGASSLLKLKRIEIQGFKSFFDRTEMRFNGSGIAAVVGPNGCGKSNLSDAISWVLGEQSAKSLRGARMEDVIFAGTRDRKPLGMASVTMTLVDPRVEAKADEVTITRRLFRSGESEYLINGRTARLRDIQDLFMGTGLGPESYAIIEQGRIGQILSNKPQDRRAVIEEAAGITRFKTKKRLAEAKLEGAKQNLSRVFDILEEVSRQVNSLKRQAAKAKRYEELRGEMVAHLRQALTGRFRMLEREAGKLAVDLNLATAEAQSFSVGIAEKEKEQSALEEHTYKTETELTEHRKRQADLQLEAERTRGKLEYQAKQATSIDQRLTQADAETKEIDHRQATHQQELETHARVLAELEEETESARQRLTAKNSAREQLQNQLRERERGMESTRQQVLRLLGEASTLKNQLAQVEEYLAAMERDTTRAQREEQMALGDIERLEQLKDDLGAKRKARQMELQSVGDRRREVEEELSVRKARAGEARGRLEAAKAELSKQKARRDSLEEVLSHRTYTTQSVKGLFTAIERGKAQGLTPSGVLADFVEVSDALYEKAAEEFLHEELEYVVVHDWQQAERGIDLMRSDLDGRATFLVELEKTAPSSEMPTAAQPVFGEGIAAKLSDVLRLTNGLTHAPSHLLPRLAKCFLATDRAAAQRLAMEHPDYYFLLPDGVSYHGRAISGGKKTGSGPLALKREVRELTKTVEARQKEVDATMSTLSDLEHDIAVLIEDLEQLRVKQQTQEKDALAIDHEQRKLNEEHTRSNSRLSVARLELDRLRKESGRSQEQRERNRDLVTQKEKSRVEQELALEQARAELTELQAKVSQIAEEHSTLRADLASFEERRRAERASQARIENQLREFAARRVNLVSEIERMGVERARLLSDNVGLDARAAELRDQITELTAIVHTLSAQEASLRAALATTGEALKLMRVDGQAAQEKRSHIEVELVRKQSELKFLDETSRKELGSPLEELAAGDETVLDEDGLTSAEEKYQEVRAKIDALGPVNPQALEEFQEAQQRYDFLNAQRQDLLDSIRDTEKAIQEIDVESRKRFGEAFEAINIHFRGMFQTLFGGGVGEMRLTDESNLADSGIDIVASPPGKKLQSVLLLSGGEKSLTAMALLMAIFRYQPSPFCILDEVDAPLDEPNIQRLTNLIREMSTQTQFIVITHAKRTMEAAQALYGVTMQEPGVSKLVSVRFQPAPQTAPLELEAVGV